MMSIQSKNYSLVVLFILFISFFSIEIIAQKEEGTLPVELIYFRAFAVGDSVWLQWGTATEVNNYGFNVERSSKDNQWAVLGFVQGNGNSHSPKHYEFWDLAIPKKDTYFYRLEQMDTDGKTDYSDTIMVDLLSSIINNEDEIPSEITLLQNYPNPFNPETTISYVIPNSIAWHDNPHVRLTVYDILGREVAKLVDEFQRPGIYTIKFKMGFNNKSSLSSAIYFYTLRVKNSILSRKMILLK